LKAPLRLEGKIDIRKRKLDMAINILHVLANFISGKRPEINPEKVGERV